MRFFLKILLLSLLISPRILFCQAVLSSNFISNTNCILKNSPVNFSDISTGSPVSWLWDFGDGSSSTIQNPSHIYLNPGKYTVSLTITDSQTSSTESKVDHIKVYNNEFIEINNDTNICSNDTALLISNEKFTFENANLYNNGWGIGSQSEGNGFQNWNIHINNTNSAGVFIGNPTNDGINNSQIGGDSTFTSIPRTLEETSVKMYTDNTS